MNTLYYIQKLYIYYIYRYIILKTGAVMDSQLPMQSVPITTKYVSLNPTYGEVYSIQQYYVISKNVSCTINKMRYVLFELLSVVIFCFFQQYF